MSDINKENNDNTGPFLDYSFLDFIFLNRNKTQDLRRRFLERNNSDDNIELISFIGETWIEKLFPELNDGDKVILAGKYFEACRLYFYDFSNDFEDFFLDLDGKPTKIKLGVKVERIPDFNFKLLTIKDLYILSICLGIQNKLYEIDIKGLNKFAFDLMYPNSKEDNPYK